MWIEVFVHKEKKGILDISKLASKRKLGFGKADKDHMLIKGETGEYTRLYDPLFPGMAMELKQDEATAELRLNFPAGSYDIDLFFLLTKDICETVGSKSFYIETVELSVEEAEELTEYYSDCSVEILKILSGQLRESKVTGLIIYTSFYPFVIGRKEADGFDNDIDKYALMINEAQRKEALYSRCWSFIGGDRNFCVYEVKPDARNILPVHPVPFLGRSMPRRCEYYVDVPGIAFFRYSDFMKHFRPSSEKYDGASVIITPDSNELEDMRHVCGVDVASGRESQFRSRGKFIDWSGYHYGKIIRKGLQTKELNCFNHIAAYLHWCYSKGLLNRSFLREYSDFADILNDRNIDLRVYLKYRVANSGAIGAEMFTAEGRRFTEYYYVFGDDGYPADVDSAALEFLGEEEYGTPEYKDEAYLFVPYTDEYRQMLFRRMDAALAKYRSLKAKQRRRDDRSYAIFDR